MEHASTPAPHAHPSYGLYVRVWVALLLLTGALLGVSRLGPAMALAGLLTISPVKAWLVLYYFMHLGSEGPLLKMVFLATLLTLLTFFVLLFSDLAFR